MAHASDESDQADTGDTGAPARREKLGEDVDTILDEIDDVLNESAEDFVRAYVQKRGQGPSDLFTAEFFIGAIAGGIAGNASYDLIKAAVKNTLASFRQALEHFGEREAITLTIPPHGRVDELANEDGSFALEADNQRFSEIYKVVRGLTGRMPLAHTDEEAVAIQFTAYFGELFREAGIIKLLPSHHQILQQAAHNGDVPIPLPQLVAHIIADWVKRNPSADRGIYKI
jgi:prokaryotic ubiquitin-like protein Pup